MPIVYVTDMQRSLDFYESLGFEPQVRSAHWSELRAGDGAVLALHVAEHSNLELALTAHDRLEEVVERHGNALVRPITDEAFGRSLALRDPDGLELQVNEHDN
jgi:catechol 2,3-dioxygenase-like lactoylglutathione lyase family enzyme